MKPIGSDQFMDAPWCVRETSAGIAVRTHSGRMIYSLSWADVSAGNRLAYQYQSRRTAVVIVKLMALSSPEVVWDQGSNKMRREFCQRADLPTKFATNLWDP